MKRALRGIALLCGLAVLIGLCGCVIEEPEPLWEPETYTGRRVETNAYSAQGVQYRIYNDAFAEAVGIDETTFSGHALLLPDAVEDYPITEIAPRAFSELEITELRLPVGLESIGEEAFRQTKIRRVELPDSLTAVGRDAFDGCLDLESVRFGTGLKELPTGMFYGCASLREVNLPEGVEVIGEACFSACDALEKVTLPDTLTVIGPYAFWSSGTKDLEFQIPAGVKAVGAGAFRSTAWLNGRTEEFVIAGDGVLLRYNGTRTDVTVPATVKYLSDAFTGTAVRRVTLPEGAEECENAWDESAVTEIVRK